MTALEIGACDDCLRRTDLIAALAGRLDVEWRRRAAPAGVLSLDARELLELGDASVRRRWDAFRPDDARQAIARAGLVAVCRCSSAYPPALTDLPDPPAVLHVAGRVEPLHERDHVGIVGARAASGYGREVARELGRTLAVAGVGVVSGLALGIDATAHEGAVIGLRGRQRDSIGALDEEPRDDEENVAALPADPRSPCTGRPHPSDATEPSSAQNPGLHEAAATAPPADESPSPHPARAADRGAAHTPGLHLADVGVFQSAGADDRRATPAGPASPVAVLAGGADKPYPARGHRLYAAVRHAGAVVSEMPPGFGVYRWAFVARNRIIAALSSVLVVVEAAERSGSLTTADFAASIGRTVAAVPGRVTSRTAAGTNGLIHDGAPLVRNTADVLDLLAEVTGTRHVERAGATRVAGLEPELRRILDRIEAGHGSLAELAKTPDEARAVLRALGELEARGLVVRGFGGRYERAV